MDKCGTRCHSFLGITCPGATTTTTNENISVISLHAKYRGSNIISLECSYFIELIGRVEEKEIKCEACRAFYRFFATSFNKFNNTGARMLDSICNMTKTTLA